MKYLGNVIALQSNKQEKVGNKPYNGLCGKKLEEACIMNQFNIVKVLNQFNIKYSIQFNSIQRIELIHYAKY
jgi:hypothetical protein